MTWPCSWQKPLDDHLWWPAKTHRLFHEGVNATSVTGGRRERKMTVMVMMTMMMKDDDDDDDDAQAVAKCVL